MLCSVSLTSHPISLYYIYCIYRRTYVLTNNSKYCTYVSMYSSYMCTFYVQYVAITLVNPSPLTLTPHPSPSLFTPHSSPLTIHSSSLTPCPSPSLPTPPSSSLTLVGSNCSPSHLGGHQGRCVGGLTELPSGCLLDACSGENL